MTGFQGRAKEKTEIPSKPTPEGFKIWVLGDHGYLFKWLWHAKGTQKGQGPQGLSPTWKQWPKMAQVVLQLLQEAVVAPRRHCVWLDNLFTSEPLFRHLRTQEIGAAGTIRTVQTEREHLEGDSRAFPGALGASSTQNSTQSLPEPASTQGSTQSRCTRSRKVGKAAGTQTGTQKGTQNRGLIRRLAELKALQNSIKWGTQYLDCAPDDQVLQIGFRDQVLVLFFTTVHSYTQKQGLQMVTRTRKRPANRNTVARAPFDTSVTKALPFPVPLDDYNH